MSRFAPREARDVARLIETQVLGLVTTHDALGYITTPLPLLAQCDEQGAVLAFVGHFARANPHVARVHKNPRSQITFVGPHGYIAPSMAGRDDWAPTWNYQFAQFEVDIALEPDRNDAAIRALVEHMEGAHGASWSVEQVASRYQRMLANVVAFRAPVRTTSARFKLGQDEDREAFDKIVASLGDGALAKAMVRQRSD